MLERQPGWTRLRKSLYSPGLSLPTAVPPADGPLLKSWTVVGPLPRGESPSFHSSLLNPFDPLLGSHKALFDKAPEINLDGIPAFSTWIKQTCGRACERTEVTSRLSLSCFPVLPSFSGAGQLTLMTTPGRKELDPEGLSGSSTMAPMNKTQRGRARAKGTGRGFPATFDLHRSRRLPKQGGGKLSLHLSTQVDQQGPY